jgi:hypothetical protein
MASSRIGVQQISMHPDRRLEIDLATVPSASAAMGHSHDHARLRKLTGGARDENP